MSNAVLDLRAIVRNYEQGGRVLSVLNNLNLAVRQGEVVALVGPSGSGKSTLLQIAGLLDTPTSGEVLLNGVSMTSASDAQRTQARGRSIGFVYQQHHLLPEFSALENVMLPQLVLGTKAGAAKDRACALLAELGLSERLHHRPAALSGGEQQRVAIARALANRPSLVLADEPTGNLDPATAEVVFDLLLRMAREKNVAMVLATHNLDMARRMDRIVKVAQV
jgi:lipoprotein-releasing system ATP-binding protein